MQDTTINSADFIPLANGGWTAKRIRIDTLIFEDVVVNSEAGAKSFAKTMRTAASVATRALQARAKFEIKNGGLKILPAKDRMLAAAIETYRADLVRRRVSKSTLDTIDRVLRQLMVACGDILVSQIGEDQIDKFFDVVNCWPGSLSKTREYRDLSDDALYALGKRLNIEPPTKGTIENIKAALSPFFKFLISRHAIDSSPLDGYAICLDENVETAEKEPLSDEQIGQIFNADAFTKWSKNSPHKWWGPLIGLYTGARVGEVAQLKVADVLFEGGIWCMAFRTTVDADRVGKRTNRSRGTSKTKSSMRKIAMPPQLIEAGFLDFVDDVRNSGHDRLFPSLPSGVSRKTGEDNGASYGNALGAQYSAYVQKNAPLGKGVAFHAFRHTMPSALYNMELDWVDIELIASITGHTLDDVDKSRERKTSKVLSGVYLHKRKADLVKKQEAALALFNPRVNLPRYVSGQFSRALGPKGKHYP